VDVTSLPAYQRAEAKNAGAIAMWTVGGAAAVTGLVLTLLNEPRPAERRPVVLPTGNGAVLHMSF
jgi:hypothetical protein